MSTYELDDDLIRRAIDHAIEVGDGPVVTLMLKIQAQVPLPIPTKVGAIVRATYTNGVYVRWTTDDRNGAPWIDTVDGEHLTSDRLGRVTQILFEGAEDELP